MALLPDIIREAKIVSGKDRVFNVKQHLFAMATGLTATSTYFDSTQHNNNNNKIFNDNNSKTGEMSKVLISRKKNASLSASNEKSIFPNLITNDANRSTAYNRVIRSSDFLNVKNSPLATRLIYNWSPVERQTSKEVESKVKIYKPPKRIDMPARPPSPFKLKIDFETSEPHFHNEKRTLEMKRMQYQREHTSWSVYPYAAVEEREHYNKKIRDTLKEQIDQRDKQVKFENENKLNEFKYVAEVDKNSLEDDRRKRIEKFNYLTTYRNENKKLMEDRWTHDYLLKRHEWQQESQLLEQDPVNWSKTLK